MDRHGRPPRHPTWDYTTSAGYFVTFVVEGRIPLLRQPSGSLSALGAVVRQVWGRLPSLYRRVELDEVAIMPEHVHAILWLTDRDGPRVPLSEVVRGWKGSSCRSIRLIHPTFRWQSHFHDRILKTGEMAVKARAYIQKNLDQLGPGRDSSRPPS